MADRPKRKGIPWRVKLAATMIVGGTEPHVAILFAELVAFRIGHIVLGNLLTAMGLRPDLVQWDHDPALVLRPVNDAGDDYVPAQLDPRHIVPRLKDAHYEKTNGHAPGQKLVTTANSDKGRGAKAKRLETLRHLASADAEAALRFYNLDPMAPVVTVGVGTTIEGYKPDDPLPPEVMGVFKTAELATRSPWPKGRKLQSRPFQKKDRP